MYNLYDFLPSGNGYKVRLLLNALGLPYTLIEKDILAGETRTEEFLKLNASGRIPLLQLEDGRCLAESNAILLYLAEGTEFLPSDKFMRAKVNEWLFFEQYSHEPNIAVVRFWVTHGGPTEEQKGILPAKMKSGYAALDVMEKQLKQSSFLTGDHFTIADIALYAYTHVAHEGEFNLSGYPAIGRWLDRVASRNNHVLITDK